MSQAAPHQEKSNRTSEQQHDLVIDTRYNPCGPIGASRGHEIVDPWLRMQYPLEARGADEDGVIQTSVNYRAEQHPDGSGVLISHAGGAVYALRMADGTVVGNENRGMMWPYDSEMEGEVPYVEVPFRFVGAVLEEQTDIDTPEEGSILDLGRMNEDENIVEGHVWMRGVVNADILPDDHEESGVLLTHESGVQAYVGWDSTSFAERQNDLFGFVPFDGEEGVPVPSAADALDLLKPHDAIAREDVARQGEWFLVRTDDYPASGTCKPGVGSQPYGGSPLESHVPRDYALGVTCGTFLERVHDEFEELPEDVRRVQEFFDWLHETGAESELYERARELADGVYVRGTLRHRHNEHYLENVGEDWHRAVTHDKEVMTVDSVNRTAVVVD